MGREPAWPARKNGQAFSFLGRMPGSTACEIVDPERSWHVVLDFFAYVGAIARRLYSLLDARRTGPASESVEPRPRRERHDRQPATMAAWHGRENLRRGNHGHLGKEQTPPGQHYHAPGREANPNEGKTTQRMRKPRRAGGMKTAAAGSAGVKTRESMDKGPRGTAATTSRRR
jgi:hypothetical protein